MKLASLRLPVLAFGLLALVVALSACGKKGDPHRPGEEPKQADPL